MRKYHVLLLVVNLALAVGFGAFFVARRNFEFLTYVGVVVGAMGLIVASVRRVPYTRATLAALTVWSAMHLAGGAVAVGDGRLYDVMIVRLSSRWPILRYDQVVHVWGFGAATLTMFCVLAGAMRRPPAPSLGLGIVVVMAGLGVGALNEIVEFGVDAWAPESGVGGYVNTSLDLCADLVGAVFGWLYVRFRYLRKPAGELRPGAA